MRFRRLAIGVCCALAACSSGESVIEEVDVTPSSGSGAEHVRLVPPDPVRFEGTPTRIGFEPIPLEGGDFPFLMDFVFLPNSSEFLAVNRFGKVGRFAMERDRAMMVDFFQIPAVFTDGDCAASSITLDPDFRVNKIFYVGYCIDAQYNVVKRYTMSDEDFGETLYTAANIIAAGDPKAIAPLHAIGTFAFAGDGMLWVNMGDRDRDANAQDTTNELGKVIRLEPLKQSRLNGYTIPNGNAFNGMPPNSGVVYAYGLGNPWRGAFDSRGRYWVADTASPQYEEINVVTTAGQNFGWPLAEGLLCKKGACTDTEAPIRMWDASPDHPYVLADPLAKIDSRFRAAWVDGEYIPGNNDKYGGLLTGKILYGDFFVGFVRGIALGVDGGIMSDEHLGHIELPVAWQQGRDGYIYVGTMLADYEESGDAEDERSFLSQQGQGQLWRVVPLP